MKQSEFNKLEVGDTVIYMLHSDVTTIYTVLFTLSNLIVIENDDTFESKIASSSYCVKYLDIQKPKPKPKPEFNEQTFRENFEKNVWVSDSKTEDYMCRVLVGYNESSRDPYITRNSDGAIFLNRYLYITNPNA